MNKKIKISKNDLIKIILTILLFYLLTEGLIFLILYRFPQMPEPFEWGGREDIPFKMNNAIKLFNHPDHEGKYKIVIMGDSRPERSLISNKFDLYFNKTTITYNFAISGTAIRAQSLFLEYLILPKLKPDLVIWEIDYWDFFNRTRENEEDNLILESDMGRFYTGNTNNLSLEDKIRYISFRNSLITRYRSIINPLGTGNPRDFLSVWSNNNLDDNNGFIPELSEFIGEIDYEEAYNPNIPFRSDGADLFYNNIKMLEKSGSKVLVIIGPHLQFSVDYEQVEDMLSKLLPEQLLYLNGDPIFVNTTLFSLDGWHLNLNGAKIFTDIVLNKLSINSYIRV